MFQVLSIYSKGGGKGGKHCLVPEVQNITAASNIAVQVFEHHFGLHFNEKFPSHPLAKLKTFDFLHSSSFLCALGAVPLNVENGLKISNDDMKIFLYLKKNQITIARAVKDFKATNLDDEESLYSFTIVLPCNNGE